MGKLVLGAKCFFCESSLGFDVCSANIGKKKIYTHAECYMKRDKTRFP